LDTLVSLQPDDTETNYLLGLITITEDTRRAFSYFDAMDRNSPRIAAVNVLREVVLNFSNPVTESDYQTLGLALIELEEWVFAERAFNAAIAFEQDWLSYTYRGYVRDHIAGQSGFDDYGNALSLAPTSPLVYYFLGLHWRQVDDLDASRDAFLNAYFLETTNPAYAVETGRAYQLLGNNIAAEDWFNVAVALEPENIQWQQLRAEFYAKEGFALDGDGIAAIQEAYALAPEDPDILTSLGHAYLQLEDIDMAQNYLELAINIKPNDARTQYIYGLVMSEQQNGEAAIAAFLQAVEIEGSTTGYGLQAARSLQQLGIALP
jgi:tetratricopeptide (TPR) repeat protein